MAVTQNSDIGWESFEGNESTTGAKNFDPAKQRIATPISPTDGGGGGVVSFNRARHPGMVNEGGQQDEMGFIRVEQSESVRGQEGNLRSELNVFLNDGSGAGDAAMVRAVAIECDRVTKINPGLLVSLQQLIGASGGGSSSSRFTSPNGRWWLQIQDDGNYVIYDAAAPQHPKAIFDLWWLLSALASLGHPYPAQKG